MKIDHLVVNVDGDVQVDPSYIKKVRDFGLPYEPKWGKGTKGFKVSNIWIGNEYLELIKIKAKDGGGWIESWTEDYLDGHRGLIGFALEVDDIDETYSQLIERDIDVSAPEPLQFKWFFNLFTKTMPWRNAYIQPFERMPFQFFLQQLNDEKTKEYMQQYMLPNSRENQINGIAKVVVRGPLTERDRHLIQALFPKVTMGEGMISIELHRQIILFIESEHHDVEVVLDCENNEKNVMQLEIGHRFRVKNR